MVENGQSWGFNCGKWWKMGIPLNVVKSSAKHLRATIPNNKPKWEIMHFWVGIFQHLKWALHQK